MLDLRRLSPSLDRESSSNPWSCMMPGGSLEQVGSPALIPTCQVVRSEGMPAACTSCTSSKPPFPDNLDALEVTPEKVAGEERNEVPPGSDRESGAWRCASRKRGVLSKVLLLCAVVAVIVTAFPVLKVHQKFPELLHWIQDNKALGFFIFVGVYAVATVLFIPGAILALGGGFVFKLHIGLLAVWLGGTIGQTVAFLLGRFLLREWIGVKARRFKVWRAIEHVADNQGWKIVGLLRLAPVIPYDALNYAFGLTAIRFWHYFFASTVGIIPGSLLFVYFGSLAECIADITDGRADIDRRAVIVAAVVSGAAIILVVALCMFFAKRALKRMLEEESLPKDETHSQANDTPPSSPNTDSARNMPSFIGKITLGGGFVDIELGAGRVVDQECADMKGSGCYTRQDTANMDERDV